MLSAKRKSDGQTVTAYLESKANGPFYCLQCQDEVILKIGKQKINHFAHINPLACRYAANESEEHRKCKMEIYEFLRTHPLVRNAGLERPLGTNRPDVSAYINGVLVAIEIQISSLSEKAIPYRTVEYARKGIYVLWLLLWTPKLDDRRYSPSLWEKWIHAVYFGQVHYWIEGLSIASYSFEPMLRSIPKKTFFSKNGKKITLGGYTRRLKRSRSPVRGKTRNLVTDVTGHFKTSQPGSNQNQPL